MTADKLALWERAVQLGCNPVWRVSIFEREAWHCTCDNNRHGTDQQCSVITWLSVERFAVTERSIPEFTFEDGVFAEAVALGCRPIMVGSKTCPTWRCECRHSAHGKAAPHPPIITWESLRDFRTQMLKDNTFAEKVLWEYRREMHA